MASKKKDDKQEEQVEETQEHVGDEQSTTRRPKKVAAQGKHHRSGPTSGQPETRISSLADRRRRGGRTTLVEILHLLVTSRSLIGDRLSPISGR